MQSKRLGALTLPAWAVFCLLASAAPLGLAQTERPPALQAHVTRLAHRLLSRAEGVGLVVGVVERGKTYTFTFGRVAKRSRTRPDIHTEFEIGSVTKTFTGMLLAECVGRGQVRYGNPLQMFLPEKIRVPRFEGRRITLLDLATHTSGLPRQPDLGGRRRFTVPEMLRFLNHYRLTRKPGSRYEYSNLGYGLLAYALERATGRNWEQLVERRIGRPLGMKDTRIHLTADQRSRLAQGYRTRGEPAPYDMPTWPAFNGAGALRSTLADMVIYLRFNLGLLRSDLNGLLPDLHREWRPGPQRESGVGLAWQTVLIPGSGRKLIMKNGGTLGFHCWIGFVPETRTGVVLMVNQAHERVFDQAGRDILLFLNR